MYNPHERKLDSQTVNGYFIGYLEKSKRYMETSNTKFLENGGVSRSEEQQNLDIK